MLDLSISQLKNTVTFVVDKQSMEQAKKAADNLKRYFEKIADPKIRFKSQKQQRQKARQMADDAKFNTSPKNTAEMKAQRAAEKQKARDEKAKIKAQQQLQRRQETAELKQRAANLQISGIKGKYGMDPKSQYEALKFVEKQTAEFAAGNISSQRMNATIRERITLLRRESAAAAKVTQVQKTNYTGAAKKVKSSVKPEYGIPGMRGMMTSFGGMFAGANLANRIQTTGNEQLQLIRQSNLVHTNPNAVKTMVAWGQQHGVDSASDDKITDNMKDIRERLGESAMNSTFDRKSGKWKGGNGAVDNVMNQFGWTKDQISKFQDRPLDFVQATVNEGQRRGMSQASIGHVIEDFGDDLMHYLPMFLNNGEEYNKTLQALISSGQTLNDEQIKQVMEYGDLTTKMTALTNGIDNSMFLGFMKGFGDSGDELVKNTKVLTEASGILGQELGNLAKQTATFVTEISGAVTAFDGWAKEHFPDWFSDKSKATPQALYDGAIDTSANWLSDKIQDATGYDTRTFGPAIQNWLGFGPESSGTAANQYGLSGQSLRDSAMAMPSSPSMNYQVNPTFNLSVAPTVPLSIQADTGRLSDYIDFQARASAASFEQSLTLGINAATSGNG